MQNYEWIHRMENVGSGLELVQKIMRSIYENHNNIRRHGDFFELRLDWLTCRLKPDVFTWSKRANVPFIVFNLNSKPIEP